MKLGKKQLRLLMWLGSPGTGLAVPDKVSATLEKRGLLQPCCRSGWEVIRISPKGLRVLADALAAGELDQFFARPPASGLD